MAESIPLWLFRLIFINVIINNALLTNYQTATVQKIKKKRNTIDYMVDRLKE